jgi:hypothetical protein
MLALALDEEVMVQQEASPDEGFGAPSHLSIILPTKKFRNTTANYEMTVSSEMMYYVCINEGNQYSLN